MNFLVPTKHPRANEAVGQKLLLPLTVLLLLSLLSYHPTDPSFNTSRNRLQDGSGAKTLWASLARHSLTFCFRRLGIRHSCYRLCVPSLAGGGCVRALSKIRDSRLLVCWRCLHPLVRYAVCCSRTFWALVGP